MINPRTLVPKAVVIIPHFNDVTRLMRCLAALLPTVPAQVEVVVVDNSSTQGLDPVRAEWPDLRIVLEARMGASSARNRGVVESTAERLFFLDCDCIPAPDWLATALRLVDKHDVIGGAVSVFDETPGPRTGAQAFEAVFAFDNRTYVERKGFSVTANLLTKRDIFISVGNFSRGISEDLDWCHRARAKGFKLVYAPELQVAHPSRGDWAALRKKWLRLTEEGFGVNGTSLLARVKWGLKALAMPVSILAHVPRILRHGSLTGAERLIALGTLTRLRFARAGWMLRQMVSPAADGPAKRR